MTMTEQPTKRMISMKVDTDLLKVLKSNLAPKKKSMTGWFEDQVVKEFGKNPGSIHVMRKHHYTRSDEWAERFLAAVKPGVNMLFEVLERMEPGWSPKSTCRKAILSDLALAGKIKPFRFASRYTTIEREGGK